MKCYKIKYIYTTSAYNEIDTAIVFAENEADAIKKLKDCINKKGSSDEFFHHAIFIKECNEEVITYIFEPKVK